MEVTTALIELLQLCGKGIAGIIVVFIALVLLYIMSKVWTLGRLKAEEQHKKHTEDSNGEKEERVKS